MSSVFSNEKRYSASGKLISDKAFYFTVALTLLFGFAVNAVEVFFFYDFFITMNPIVFLIAYVVLYIAGSLINVLSKNPVLSFIGYCMVVLPLGAILSIYVPAVGISAVRSAFLATALISVIMALLAVMYPKFFYSIYMTVLVCLSVALVCQLIACICGLSAFYAWVDWLVVVLFACYIGIDISLAQGRPKTVDNAITSACALYIDVIYVAIRLMRIFSKD